MGTQREMKKSQMGRESEKMEMQRGAFMRGLDRMIIKEIPKPKAGKGNVVVSLEYIGICGSDLHYFHTGRIGNFVVDLEQDYMLGHECAGTVVETGEGVSELKIGDRVALEPGVVSGKHEMCRMGKYNLDPDVRFLATPPVPGCNEEFIEFPADFCFKLPENVTTKEGALIEPLSVGFHAANQGEVGVGDTVVILGAGTIGLVTLLSCKAHGAGKIIVVDLIPAKLEAAKRMGADFVIDGREENAMKEVLRCTESAGADKVFETAGSAHTIAMTPYVVKRGGTIVLVGLASNPKITYDFGPVMDKEITIRSVFRYRNIFPKAIAAVSKGAIDVKQIVTHEYDFSHIEEAYREALQNKTDMIKCVIKVK